MRTATRYVVLLPNLDPLAGVCPACDGIMDDSGCRIGVSYGVRPAARRRTGIGHFVEVFCRGVPAHPIRPCPACEHTP